jgi:hypothetical protein
MSSAQGERLERNCKLIWGAHCDYDFDVETDDWEWYSCVVKQDFGSSVGPPLIMTGLRPSEEAAWKELEKMLESFAEAVTRDKT